MYGNIPGHLKEDQYRILLHRAHQKAMAVRYPARDLDVFRKEFRDRDVAARFLSAEDLEIYDACRGAGCK